MSGTNIVFDTSALINLINKQCDLLAMGVDAGSSTLYTSVIVRMELLSKRNIQDREEVELRNFLDEVVVVKITRAIEQKAIEIRRATTLKLPDCIIAATAIVLNAMLLTDDDHLLKLSWPGLQAKSILPDNKT